MISPSPDCANTLAGLAFYALEQWKWFRAAYQRETNNDTKWIYNGRLYAYADMLHQITGKRDLESWEQIVKLMGEGKL